MTLAEIYDRRISLGATEMARLRKACDHPSGHSWALADVEPLGTAQYCVRCFLVPKWDPIESHDGKEIWFRQYGCGYRADVKTVVDPADRDWRPSGISAGGRVVTGGTRPA
jgi:hypothetical protein